MKYKFKSYYKYEFTLELENGDLVSNRGDGGEIYRLILLSEGKADEVDGGYDVDGVFFEKL